MTTPDHAGRVERLRTLLTSTPEDVTGLVVTSLVNVRYLSGFTGSNAALLVLPDHAVLVTDGRYLDQATFESPHVALIEARQTFPGAVRIAGERGLATIGVEAEHLSLAQYRLLANGDVTLSPTTGLVEQLRRRKDDHEVAQLQAACALISGAVEAVLPRIHVGLTERRIDRMLTDELLDRGADGPAFPAIVAGGPNSAIPHHTPTDRSLQAGDLLKIDAGALVAGYHSDMTRTYVVGAEPTARQRDLHAAVAAAAASARQAVAAGVAGQVPDEAAREVLRDCDLEDRYRHGLGHGVGLQIHEAPMLGRDQTDTIAAGDVLTIEPGAYVPGFGGVRIEDTLAVTDSGTQCLTTVARDLIRLG